MTLSIFGYRAYYSLLRCCPHLAANELDQRISQLLGTRLDEEKAVGSSYWATCEIEKGRIAFLNQIINEQDSLPKVHFEGYVNYLYHLNPYSGSSENWLNYHEVRLRRKSDEFLDLLTKEQLENLLDADQPLEKLCPFEKNLGAGTHGIVHLISVNGHPFAVKTGQNVNWDFFIGQKFDHESILKVHLSVSKRGKTHLIMEYIDGESPRPNNLSLRRGAELLSACAHMHLRGYYNMEIAGDNILISSNKAKVIDHGATLPMQPKINYLKIKQLFTSLPMNDTEWYTQFNATDDPNEIAILTKRLCQEQNVNFG